VQKFLMERLNVNSGTAKTKLVGKIRAIICHFSSGGFVVVRVRTNASNIPGLGRCVTVLPN
jgi:hypothetical protein